MSVIVELQVNASDFELGRILGLAPSERIEMETVVPATDRMVPLFWVFDDGGAEFEANVESHSSVECILQVDVFEDRALYALEWDVGSDRFFQAVSASRGSVTDATGYSDGWYFEVRFPSHDDLGAFRTKLDDADIDCEVLRLYNPTKPDAGPWYGLTPTQREAIVLAVESGYYDIPRKTTTVELAEELDISDQAVTERLRRAIVNLVSNSLLAAETNQD